MLLVRYRRERFTAGAQIHVRRKGDKNVIPRPLKGATFIAIFICHGNGANGIFSHSVYRWARTQV